MAYERTVMASIRTYLALLRAGLATTGSGALITSILDSGWPQWAVVTLSAVFVVIGFGVMIWRLQQYHQVMALVEDSAQISIPSIRLLAALTIFLQLMLVVALLLFPLG
ncbi:MAG: DUF202 domain-containing protein [Nitrospiraceae bacterium]